MSYYNNFYDHIVETYGIMVCLKRFLLKSKIKGFKYSQ